MASVWWDWIPVVLGSLGRLVSNKLLMCLVTVGRLCLWNFNVSWKVGRVSVVLSG